MNSNYLNVDCILKSNKNLSKLVDYLKHKVFLLWNEHSSEGSFIGLETNLLDSDSPEMDILEFVNLFNSMPIELMEVLSSCEVKAFSIGIEGGNEGDPFNTSIDHVVLKKTANLGFSLSIRVYPTVQKQGNLG